MTHLTKNVITSEEAEALRRRMDAEAQRLEDRDWRTINPQVRATCEMIQSGQHCLTQAEMRALADSAKRLEAIGGNRRLELGQLYAMAGNLGNECRRQAQR